MASFPLNHLLEGCLQTWAHSEMPGARAQCMNLRGHKSAHHPICEQLPQIFISLLSVQLRAVAIFVFIGEGYIPASVIAVATRSEFSPEPN